MKKAFCDVRGCKEEAEKLQVDVCVGWTDHTTSFSGGEETINYEPFEKPTISKRDLCKKHYKAWCKATYNAMVKAKDRIK